MKDTMKAKQTEQKEVGRVKLSDTQELVASLVDGEKLDLRVFVKSEEGELYRGYQERLQTLPFW